MVTSKSLNLFGSFLGTQTAPNFITLFVYHKEEFQQVLQNVFSRDLVA